MDHLSGVLTAISHPTRRAIIGRLAADGPTRFLDVAEPFDTALNSVTKHLKILERAGLITRERNGREVLLSFRAEPLREVAKPGRVCRNGISAWRKQMTVRDEWLAARLESVESNAVGTNDTPPESMIPTASYVVENRGAGDGTRTHDVQLGKRAEANGGVA
jgi:DNA-binding transcriptional ArsR family regulator